MTDQYGSGSRAALVVGRDLHKNYAGRPVVRGVSLELLPGEVVGLLGVNGAGKTTLMRMLVGLALPSQGSVEAFGRTAPFPREVACRIGAALDTPQFYRWMTGRALLRTLLHTGGQRDRGEVAATLERVDLTAQADKRIRAYSQGMRQRLALAAALMRRPDVLLLDEPTNGLDPQGIRMVRRLVEEERRRGAAVLVSSHQLDEIQRICDRVVVIAQGAVAAAGAPHQLGIGGPGRPQTLEDWFFALHGEPHEAPHAGESRW